MPARLFKFDVLYAKAKLKPQKSRTIMKSLNFNQEVLLAMERHIHFKFID